MNERESTLNELAQGLRPVAEGLAWFDGLAEEEQPVVLRDLTHFCLQARATHEDAVEGVRRSGLRPTHTPAVLATRGRVDHGLWGAALLRPRHERIKAFRLLVQVLALADARRRARHCADGCTHDWHQLKAPDAPFTS